VDDGKEIDSAVIGEAAAAACKADAAVPVASEPSASARFIWALPARELPAGGAVAALAAVAAGVVRAAEAEDVCESARPLPEVASDVLAGAAPLTTPAATEFVGAPAVMTGAASDPDFAAAAAGVVAGGAPADSGVSDADDAEVEFEGAASEAVDSISVVAGPKTAPCPSCVVALVAPAPRPTEAVPALDVLAPDVLTLGAPALDVPAMGDEPAAEAPPIAGVAPSEPLSSASSRVEGRTGVPLAGGARSCEAAPGEAGAGAAAAGGAPLPEGGNGSPLALPPADLVESSFFPALAEARSSARAKSRA
jgi:hypothetical protein